MNLSSNFESRCGECVVYGAIQGLSDGLILIDAAGRIVHLNRKAEEILDVRSRQVEGAVFRNRIRHQGLASFWDAARNEAAPVSAEIGFPGSRTIRASVSLCVGTTGTPLGKALLLRDITREKRIQVELSSDVAKRLVRMAGNGDAAADLPPLTRREREILELVAGGLSNASIASRLEISTNTVASHLKHLYAKIHVASRSQAAAFALTHGVRPPNGTL